MLKTKDKIAIAISLIIFSTTIVIFKLTYRDIAQPSLAKDNESYEIIDFNGNISSYQQFESLNPKFRMAIPVGYKMNTIMEKEDGKIYDMRYKNNTIRIRIIDIYGLTNVRTTAREAYSFNTYSDFSMKLCFNEYIKKYQEHNTENKILESGIKKLKGNLLIFLKIEQLADNGKAIQIIQYNFQKDGYSIELIGYTPEPKSTDQIIKSMNSFSFSE